MSHLVLNQILKGRKGSYQIIKALTQNVFQAIIEGTSTSVVIKAAPEHPGMFLNEANVYRYDSINKSPYIRSMREYINNGETHCLVLEWMDNTLWETRTESTQAKAKVFKTVARSCLKALTAFRNIDGTGQCLHADLNPNNVLVSGFSSPTPVVKLADLGWTIRTGTGIEDQLRIQGAAIRAPEIWKGGSPSAACDVWSLGVSLAHWMSSRVMFGPGGCNIRTNLPQEVTEAGWCIAKLHEMQEAELEGPVEEAYVMEWGLAYRLVSEGLIQVPTLGEELKKKEVPPECIAFIEHLLVVDPMNRPSTVEALEHPLLQGG